MPILRQKTARSQVSRALPANGVALGGQGDRPSVVLSGVSGDDDTLLSTVGAQGELWMDLGACLDNVFAWPRAQPICI